MTDFNLTESEGRIVLTLNEYDRYSLTVTEAYTLAQKLNLLVASQHRKANANPKAKRMARQHMSHLTEQQVLEIHADRRPYLEIAKAFEISLMTVSNIKLGKTWKHLGLPPTKRNTKSLEKFIQEQARAEQLNIFTQEDQDAGEYLPPSIQPKYFPQHQEQEALV